MKKIKYLLFPLLCICCIENRNIFNATEKVFDHFNEEYYLQAKAINFDSIVMKPRGIFHIDSFLIFGLGRGHPHFYSIYNLQTNSFVGAFLQRGRGPNEFLSLNYWNNHSLQNNQRWLYLSAINEKQVIKFNLSDFLQSGSINIEILNQYKDLQMNTHILNDSTFLAYMFTQNNKDFRVFYRKYYSTSDKREEINLTKKNVRNYEEFNLLWAAEHIRQDGKKMAMAMSNMNRVHIFNLEEPTNNITLTPKGQKHILLSDLSQQSFHATVYYSAVKTTQDYIFALFHNQFFVDWQHCQSKKVEIHVFNWNGLPIYKLHIDECLSNFCIDPGKKIMYAYDHEENIYQYDLSKIL